MLMPDTHPILAELKDYSLFKKKNPDFRLSDYAWYRATPDIIVSLMTVLWPKFMVFNGGVFFEEGFPEDVFRQWMNQFGGDVRKTERIMNHQHVRDLIRSEDRLPDPLVRYLGDALVCFWAAAASAQFPQLPIVVTSEWDEENSDVIISIYQTGDN